MKTGQLCGTNKIERLAVKTGKGNDNKTWSMVVKSTSNDII